MSFFDNTRKPVGVGGRMMVSAMNLGHRALADWGFGALEVQPGAMALDCGCGGGANIAKLLEKCPAGKVMGIDYSEVGVKSSRRLNRKAIEAGRCEVYQASAAELPFEDARFDLVTAFETVYFWQDPVRCFGEVRRVLKPGGAFFICNECGGDNQKDDKWTEIVDGMKIYNDAQLADMLTQAGFGDIRCRKNKKGWLCVTARKNA